MREENINENVEERTEKASGKTTEETMETKSEKFLKELVDVDGPGLDKQGAMYMAEQVGENASPCAFCNRMDCMECRFAY